MLGPGWDTHTQSQRGECCPISPDPRAVIKIRMAYEGDEGEGWETGREKKCIELICLWEFCPLFIEMVRQLEERMLQDQLDRESQGSVSTWE